MATIDPGGQPMPSPPPGQTQVTAYARFILLSYRDSTGQLTTRAYPYSAARAFARAVMDLSTQEHPHAR